MKRYDLVTMGRSSIDLYSNDIGSAFSDIESFGAFVGGCPTNIAVGCARLGMKTALLTAVGADPVGDFVCKFLDEQGVDTAYIPTKADRRTSAVVLGIEPPDKFPLVFYRDGCADIEIGIDDIRLDCVTDTAALLITGTGLSREPSRSATFYAAEKAKSSGATVILDVDFRADQWHDPRAFGVVLRSVLPLIDLVIGTEDELKAMGMTHAGQLQITDGQISDPRVTGDLESIIGYVLSNGPETLVLKRGADGASVFSRDGSIHDSAPFAVDVCNILGAGDAFAAGFLYGHNKGWDLLKSARMGNATGAIVVTRQGCANFMPYENEALEFIERAGGF